MRTSYGYQDPGKSVASDDRSGNLRNRHHQFYSKKRVMVDLGLLKSGKVELRSPIDRGNLRKLLDILQKVSSEITINRGNLRQ